MADGRPRAKSIQISGVHTVGHFGSSSSEPLNCQSSQTLKAFEGGNVEWIAKQWSDSETIPNSRPHRGPHIRGFGRKNEHILSSEDESDRMQASPAGSGQGSTQYDRTPRIHPRDAPTALQAFQNSKHDIPPFRSDSAYESDKGMQPPEPAVNVDVQAQNLRARERVEILRGRVVQTRYIINDSREEVRLLRDELRDATDKLMRAFDELMVAPTAPTVSAIGLLSPLREAARAAQDKLGPAEDAHDILERRLNRQEQELEQEEMHFYTHNNIPLSIPPNLDLSQPIAPLIKPYQPDTNFSGLDLNNELIAQYLAKVHEAEQLKENLDFLEDEQYRLTQELAFRTRYNLELSEENSSFLFSFPKEHHDLLLTLEKVEDELYALRDQCIDADLFNASDYPYEPRDALVDEIDEALNDVLDRNPLRTAALNSSIPEIHEVNYADKREYVNTWLLEWAQDSSVEAWRLRSFIVPADQEGNKNEKWPELALEFWFTDQAGEFAMKHHVLSTMDALLGSVGLGTGSSLDVDLGDLGLGDEEVIMGSETGSYRTQIGIQTEEFQDQHQYMEDLKMPRTHRSGTITRASSV